MRLIDADALIGPIKLQEESYRRCGAIERVEAYANCLWEIEHAPIISGWTSVKDEMPELEGDYWVTDGHLVPWKCRFLKLAGVKGWVDSISHPAIKYWMPFPELPKKGEVG